MLPVFTSWAALVRFAELVPRVQASKIRNPLPCPVCIYKALSSLLQGKLTLLAEEHKFCYFKAQKASAQKGTLCRRNVLQEGQQTFCRALRGSRTVAQENRVAVSVDQSQIPSLGLAQSACSVNAYLYRLAGRSGLRMLVIWCDNSRTLSGSKATLQSSGEISSGSMPSGDESSDDGVTFD